MPQPFDKPAEIDPITLEVIRHGIISICDQIDANMTRTAFSPYIYEYKDYAVGFVGASSLERLAVEDSLTQLTQRFKKIPVSRK